MTTQTRASILLVDDDDSVRSALRRVLTAEDFEILEVSSGVAGLAMLRRRPVDVILSDLRMPGMDGLEFLRSARVIRPEAVRIVLTGHTDIESCIRAINEDAVFRFLLKPWDNLDLSFIVRRALRHQKNERRVARMAEILKRQMNYLEELEEKNPEMFMVERTTRGGVRISDEELQELGLGAERF